MTRTGGSSPVPGCFRAGGAKKNCRRDGVGVILPATIVVRGHHAPATSSLRSANGFAARLCLPAERPRPVPASRWRGRRPHGAWLRQGKRGPGRTHRRAVPGLVSLPFLSKLKAGKHPVGKQGMSHHDQSQIEKRAHEIWEREGRPDGRAAEHWQQAVAELDEEAAAAAAAEAAAAKAAKAAPAASAPVATAPAPAAPAPAASAPEPAVAKVKKAAAETPSAPPAKAKPAAAKKTAAPEKSAAEAKKPAAKKKG